MATKTPPATTMGTRMATESEPAKDDEPKKAAPKALKSAAEALCKVLTGGGDVDYGKFSGEFEAFAKAAKSADFDVRGLDVSIMDEDVSNSIMYGERVRGRKEWAAKLAAL